jgi:DNA-binding NarL/FixJ family response regulator
MMVERQVRILIADDHPVFRFGLRALVESQQDLLVTGEAESGAEAVEMVRRSPVDVVLMDVNMPDIDGIEATRRIVATSPDIAVLVITMFDDETVLAAMQAGARGYLLKGAQGLETLRAIRAVANGEVIVSPGVAAHMMAYFGHGRETSRGKPADTHLDDLTPREWEILNLLAQGLTNGAIAEKLTLSPKTIRNQVSIIYGKLQVGTRSEAIVKAREAGLGK